jgi:hypothetical protein
MDTPHRRLFRRSFIFLEVGGLAGMKAGLALKKRCGTIRNYHGNQRLTTRGPALPIDLNRIAGGLISHRWPLTSYPNIVKEQARRSAAMEDTTIYKWDSKLYIAKAVLYDFQWNSECPGGPLR